MPPSEDELRRIWEHVAYEIGMFAYCQERLAQTSYRQGERSALLEAYAVHARALFDFLFHVPAMADRPVLAVHFVRDLEAWRYAKGKTPRVLDQLKTRVGTEVAHLTYDRLEVGPEAKGWDIPEISKALRGALATFLAHARDEFPPIVIGPEAVPDALVVATGTDHASSTHFTMTSLKNTREPDGT